MPNNPSNRPFQKSVTYHEWSGNCDLLGWLALAVNDNERREVLSELNCQFMEVARAEKWETALIFSLRGSEMDDIRTRIWKKTIEVN